MHSARLAAVLAPLVALAACAPSASGPEAQAAAEPAAVGAVSAPADAPVSSETPSAYDVSHLTDLQREVTQECGTEPAFDNAYWDNEEPGLYVDVVSGEPLFASVHKYESGSGWPSFWKPLEDEDVVEVEDRTYGMVRTEVRSAGADSHLGHVFDDGPNPTGLRYCINSAALRFVPLAELAGEGYAEFLPLFPDDQLDAAGYDPAALPRPTEAALLAGGCFWGMEDILRSLPGVLDTEVGYTGGTLEDPTYEDLKRGDTGHAEAIRLEFDPTATSYAALLDVFFRMHDPTTPNRQGNDRGESYRSAIFYLSPEQEAEARAAIERAEASGRWERPIVTEVTAASTFYPAEDYHQDYLVKNPGGYTCHFLRD